jgi:hypothetical protein
MLPMIPTTGGYQDHDSKHNIFHVFGIRCTHYVRASPITNTTHISTYATFITLCFQDV